MAPLDRAPARITEPEPPLIVDPVQHVIDLTHPALLARPRGTVRIAPIPRYAPATDSPLARSGTVLTYAGEPTPAECDEIRAGQAVRSARRWQRWLGALRMCL